MLNKELLLTNSTSVAGHAKLTVGFVFGNSFGYAYNKGGSINNTFIWNSLQTPGTCLLVQLYSNPASGTSMIFRDTSVRPPSSIRVTVIEKGSTIELTSSREGIHDWGMSSSNVLFWPEDEGKTFTLVFDPPPLGFS